MAVTHEPIDSNSDAAALDALNEIRLSRNWSYQGLANDMERLGHGLPAKTLHALLVNRPAKPYDRTMYQVRGYLSAIQDERTAVIASRQSHGASR